MFKELYSVAEKNPSSVILFIFSEPEPCYKVTVNGMLEGGWGSSINQTAS